MSRRWFETRPEKPLMPTVSEIDLWRALTASRSPGPLDWENQSGGRHLTRIEMLRIAHIPMQRRKGLPAGLIQRCALKSCFSTS